MAGKAAKKQAQANEAVLRTLYTFLVPSILAATLRILLSGTKKSWLAHFILHSPQLACVYILERSGRPRYSYQNGKPQLISEGTDLSQSGGLLDYMFDIVYLSMAGDIGRALFNTNKIWYLTFIVSIAYAAWKFSSLIKAFIPKRNKIDPPPQSQPQQQQQNRRTRRANRS